MIIPLSDTFTIPLNKNTCNKEKKKQSYLLGIHAYLQKRTKIKPSKDTFPVPLITNITAKDIEYIQSYLDC